jgi:hypothetical protein
MISALKISHSLACLFIVTMFVACFCIPTFAQSPSDINVSTAVAIAVPGHLLEPGDYVFRRVNESNPRTYEIVDSNGKFIGLIEAAPSQRPEAGDAQVEISAPDASGVRLVEAWYGAGDANGYQILYTQKDIRKLNQIVENQNRENSSFAGQP